MCANGASLSRKHGDYWADAEEPGQGRVGNQTPEGLVGGGRKHEEPVMLSASVGRALRLSACLAAVNRAAVNSGRGGFSGYRFPDNMPQRGTAGSARK